MQRRDFFKLAAWSGLCVVTPASLLTRRAQSSPLEPYSGPFFVAMNAAGGWDPTSLCDPKGVNAINRTYDQGDIATAGRLTYAPVGANRAFFEAYHQELLVLNGVDMSTNSHNPGQRYAWTGRLDNAGYPTFTALAAAALAPGLPLSYLSFGGYDASGNIIPLARVSNPERIGLIANHDLIEGNPERPYHAESTRALIEQAVAARHQAHHTRHDHLPRTQQAMSTLFTAKLSSAQLKRITEFLPQTLPEDQLQRQATIALAAYKAGLCVGVNLVLGGFDTHDDHDNRHIPRLSTLLQGADHLLKQAERLQVRDRVVLVLGSDFARTPRYNNGNGKDHWSVGSMMLLGPGIQGNRVLGATNEEQRARSLNYQTLQLDDSATTRLRPEHIHTSLRRLAGIQDHPLSQRFPLPGPALELFAPA